jgi:hypothetical protein
VPPAKEDGAMVYGALRGTHGPDRWQGAEGVEVVIVDRSPYEVLVGTRNWSDATRLTFSKRYGVTCATLQPIVLLPLSLLSGKLSPRFSRTHRGAYPLVVRTAILVPFSYKAGVR